MEFKHFTQLWDHSLFKITCLSHNLTFSQLNTYQNDCYTIAHSYYTSMSWIAPWLSIKNVLLFLNIKQLMICFLLINFIIKFILKVLSNISNNSDNTFFLKSKRHILQVLMYALLIRTLLTPTFVEFLYTTD